MVTGKVSVIYKKYIPVDLIPNRQNLGTNKNKRKMLRSTSCSDCIRIHGDVVFTTGWGQMTHPDSAAIKLQQAPMPIVSNRVCQAKHMKSPVSKEGGTAITSAMLCAGDAGKTKISGCFGDSGGPFVCKTAAGQWVQQGIVSWGDTTCSSKSHFTVFARVSAFRQWIEDTINE